MLGLNFSKARFSLAPRFWTGWVFYWGLLFSAGILGLEFSAPFFDYSATDTWYSNLLVGLALGVFLLSLIAQILLNQYARVAEALRQSEAFYRNLIEDQAELIWRFRASGELTFVNAAFCFYFDRSATQLLGQRFFDFIHESDRARVLRILARLNQHMPSCHLECWVMTSLGMKYQRWTIRALFEDGVFTECQATARDMTEQRETERALRESEERYRALVEHAPEACVVFDVDKNRVVDLNTNAEVLFKTPMEKLLGMRPFELSPILQPDGRPSKDAAREYVSAALNGQTPHFEWLHHDADGGDVICEVRLVRLPGEGRRLIRGSLIDITERKQIEIERKRWEAKVQQAQKMESLGVLAGGIAHDFNNLLSGIMGFADLAQQRILTDVVAQDYLHEVLRGSERAADLCKQLLAYSGKGRFTIMPVDLAEIANDIRHLLEISISKKAELDLRLQTDAAAVDADVTQLRQVLLNLITNASDALQEQSGVITMKSGEEYFGMDRLNEFYGESLLPRSYVYLEVSDTGCGMSPEIQKRMFDPFFTSKSTGRGLGLAAVMGIIRGHRAGIRVRSQPGQGTTITVIFPPSTELARHLNKPQRVSDQWRGHGVVLVVDDEATIRELAQTFLQNWGFEVLTAADGAAGVEVFRQNASRIRAVILDMTMPKLSGEEVFNEIRKINPDVAVVLSTGYDEQEATGRFTGKGLAGFVQKPYRGDDLKRVLKQVLKTTTPVSAVILQPAFRGKS
ncbi:MAG: PAS domain S-box protein [Gammaproteobacteria bacterium]|nr:PAS domain S-box protein [Gammaproteobacteria bacterium]